VGTKKKTKNRFKRPRKLGGGYPEKVKIGVEMARPNWAQNGKNPFEGLTEFQGHCKRLVSQPVAGGTPGKKRVGSGTYSWLEQRVGNRKGHSLKKNHQGKRAWFGRGKEEGGKRGNSEKKGFNQLAP